MACSWRIRHKLILGLGLVVGILGLLLAGTLKGLMSYRATIKSFDSKMIELKEANALKLAVTRLAIPAQSGRVGTEEPGNLKEKVQNAREALAAYAGKLANTVKRRRDPEGGFHESELIKALQDRFDRLDEAVAEASGPQANPESHSLLGDVDVQQAIARLVGAANELEEAIYQDLYNEIMPDATVDQRRSMIVVVSTSVVGVLLMAGLLRFFYGWVFSPIRDLQVGVSRVAQGDFDHSIELDSGDEMEDFARAFNDMTGRLRDMYRDLARQVNERSRQLVRSERLASVGFLAAGVAHEINNPLASIAFCGEALESRLTGALVKSSKDCETIAKYLKMIQEEAFRCKAITQRLLEFSRGGEKRREPTDLAELIQSVIDMVQHLQNFKGKKFAFDPAGKLTAWVNAQEIKSVVLNLVINALESMDEGGTLTVRLAQRDQMAELVFADTGCGMTAEVLENIFEPFFTRSRTGKGTGLGLSISHRVITQHGGEIEAASPGPNQGSTFTVRLPLKPVEPAKENELGHAA